MSVCVVLVVDVSCQQQGQQTEDNRVNGQQQQQQQQPCSPFQGCIQSPRLNFNPIDKFRSASRTFASAAKYLKDAIAYKKKTFFIFLNYIFRNKVNFKVQKIRTIYGIKNAIIDFIPAKLQLEIDAIRGVQGLLNAKAAAK